VPATKIRRYVPLLLLAASLGGCAQPAQEVYIPPPLVVDGAMQRREWDRSVAPYPNGDTVSGHNRFPVRSNAPVGENEYGPAVVDVGASLVQTIALPFTYLVIPPFAKAVYTGEKIGPTYTGMPPMRPADTTVEIDGLIVDRDTLEVRRGPRKVQDEAYRRHGPIGPGDTDFNSSEPVPAREWE
jgi:hypothetical protein